MRLICCVLISALAASAQVKLPGYSRNVLENGVVLELLAKKDVPMVTLRAVIRGGSESDPADKAGLASITTELLRRGTSKWSAEEFSQQLDFIGASFSTGVDEQSSIMVSEFLGKDTDHALELFNDAILRPEFPQEEIDKVLAQRIDAAISLKDNPRSAVSRYFRSFFYPSGHPYRRQVGGDELSLAGIKRQDIQNYHKSLYAGKNMIIIAAGDFDPDSLRPKLSKAFGGAPSGNSYQWNEKVPALEWEGPRLLLVDKPDSTQTYFVIGQPGIYRTHGNRVVLELVDTLFGGRFTSMLNDELRVNSGLTYGAFSWLDQNRLPGAIAIETFTATETTVKAIDLALEVLKRMHENGISSEQLASAKAYTKGRYPTRRLETAGQLASALGELELFGLDRDEVDGLFERIDRVTLDEVNAAIRKHYRLENLQIVLVGNAADIRESVSGYAPEMVEIPITKPGFHPDGS